MSNTVDVENPSDFKITDYIGADTETTGLNTQNCHAFCIGFCNTLGQRLFLDFREGPEKVEIAQAILESSVAIFHNAKFDIKQLANKGLRVDLFRCTQTLAYNINEYEPSLKLDSLSFKYFKEQKFTNERFETWKKINKESIEKYGYYHVPKDILIPYTLQDAELALKLFFLFKGQTEKDEDLKKQYERDLQLIQDIILIERNGMYIDVEKGFKNAQYLKDLCDKYKKLFTQGYKLENPNSPKQIIAYYKSIGINLESSKKAIMLERAGLGDQFAKDILKYRQADKILNTFLIGILENTNRTTRRLHSSFNTTATKTTRLSSSDPVNFQNLPRAVEDPNDIRNFVRELIIPTKGYYLIGGDFDQEEMRILADESDCKELLNLFNSGISDVYIEIAKLIWPLEDIDKQLRYIAKQSTLGISYGMGANRFVAQAAQYGINLDYDEAFEVITIVKDRFPEVHEMLRKCSRDVKQYGYVKDRFGRKYHVPQKMVDKKTGVIRDVTYKAFNAIIQGTAAQIMKYALHLLVEKQKENPSLFKVINTVHDEVLCEVHESIPVQEAWKIIKERCESVSKFFKLPIKMSPKFYDGNWAKLKKENK